MRSSRLVLLVAKLVDDPLITGDDALISDFLSKFNIVSELGTIKHGPGVIRFNGLTIFQNENMFCIIDGDDKLNVPEPMVISRECRKQTDYPLNSTKSKHLRSLNSSLGWLEIAASPFCSFFASYYQQKFSSATVSTLTS